MRLARKVLRGHKSGDGSEAETTVKRGGSTQAIEAPPKPLNHRGTKSVISGLWSN